MRTLAAASSIARGSPSSDRVMSAIASTVSSSSARSGPHGPRSIDEEPDRFQLEEWLDAGRLIRVHDGEWWNQILLFPCDAQGGSRRRQDQRHYPGPEDGRTTGAASTTCSKLSRMRSHRFAARKAVS